jgi:hypothetical protein
MERFYPNLDKSGIYDGLDYRHWMREGTTMFFFKEKKMVQWE